MTTSATDVAELLGQKLIAAGIQFNTEDQTYDSLLNALADAVIEPRTPPQQGPNDDKVFLVRQGNFEFLMHPNGAQSVWIEIKQPNEGEHTADVKLTANEDGVIVDIWEKSDFYPFAEADEPQATCAAAWNDMSWSQE